MATSDQSPLVADKPIEAQKAGGDNTLPTVDRVDLLKSYTPADPGVLSKDVPNLTVVGWEKHEMRASADPRADQRAEQREQRVEDTKVAEVDPKQQRIDKAKQALESPDATIKDKVQAMSSLYNDLEKGKDGRVHITLNDNGKARDFEISNDSAGKNVQLFHLATRDESGKAHPVLRAVERNGEIEQQRHKNGQKADFRGDWWSANAQDSTVAKFRSGDSDMKPAPRVEDKKADEQRAAEEQRAREEKALADKKKQPVDKTDGTGSDTTPVRIEPKVEQKVEPKVEQKVEPKVEPKVEQKVEPAADKKGDVVIPWPKERSEKETDSNGRVIRNDSDRAKFYTRQDDGWSCAGMSVAMLDADQRLGRPVRHGKEAQAYKALTGTLNHGYRGSLETMANQMEQIGLNAKAYTYGMGKISGQTMRDLNNELDKGHSAVARVINPHTGNPHYIYIAGRDANGHYILGDPDRKNPQHFKPVTQKYLQSIMQRRDGFVAGWK